MKALNFRLVGVRCFEDTGEIDLHPKCNLLVGKNNSGKSTLLKAFLDFQGFPFQTGDIRPLTGRNTGFVSALFSGVDEAGKLTFVPSHRNGTARFSRTLTGNPINYEDYPNNVRGVGQHQFFNNTRPNHTIVPFLAKRKASQFSHDVTKAFQDRVDGTLHNLYSRIDLLVPTNHPKHAKFDQAVKDIIGLPLATSSSTQGKQAGFYFDDDTFVTLEQMGDGVSEMVALIVELCIEKNKIFILEEPEISIHPSGLKALLGLVREASDSNQFLIATHSNIVVKELGASEVGKVFRVFKDGDSHSSPSRVQHVDSNPIAHIELLEELGHSFSDYQLHDAWLFLEESTAETIINQILIPQFVPTLAGRLRTFSSSGVEKLEVAVDEFKRLIVFVHLQAVYQGRVWVRADGDVAGLKVIERLKATFTRFSDGQIENFAEEAFENYYPNVFADKVKAVLAEKDKNQKKVLKTNLVLEVVKWTRENVSEAIKMWESSAHEPISVLKAIDDKLARKE